VNGGNIAGAAAVGKIDRRKSIRKKASRPLFMIVADIFTMVASKH
jgi:hypothetical protein